MLSIKFRAENKITPSSIVVGPYWAMGGARSITLQGLIFCIQLKARISNHTSLVGPKSMLLCLHTTHVGPFVTSGRGKYGPNRNGTTLPNN